MSTRTLSDSTFTHIIDVQADKVDIAEWLFTLPEAEFQQCCPPDHVTVGVGTGAGGRPMSIGVEQIGKTLLIHHYIGEVVAPHHCRMVSTSDAVTPDGRTTVQATWELRAEATDDGRCTITNRLMLTPTGDYFAFLDGHGITYEDAADTATAAAADHNRRETPGFAASIARRASTPNGRHAMDSVPAAKIRNGDSAAGPDGEAAKAVVRRNTEEVQGGGDYAVFDELFADDFVDHTPQPGRSPDKDGARLLYHALRAAFPDFHAEIHWQTVDGDVVTTYKTYHGTHRGAFMDIAPTGREVAFETVDAMRVHDGRIVEHWGVANLYSLMKQLG
ncbi:ester cyclase [Rhodococcus sp. BE178]|uniref:ester cyclase n=1 Tax=Rhodococcus sp. BE178 TaxID=2817737 RepID=UPI003D1968E5